MCMLILIQPSSLESIRAECSNISVIILPGCDKFTADIIYTFSKQCSNSILVSLLPTAALLCKLKLQL